MQDWIAAVPTTSEQALQQPLLRCADHSGGIGAVWCIALTSRSSFKCLSCKRRWQDGAEAEQGPGLLLVNFDPALTEMLREVHYLTRMPGALPAAIPLPATTVRSCVQCVDWHCVDLRGVAVLLSVFILHGWCRPRHLYCAIVHCVNSYPTAPPTTQLHERSAVLQQWLLSLEAMCGAYNTIQHSLLPIERPLLTGPLQQLQEVVQVGAESLHWNIGAGVDAFLVEGGAAAREVQALVESMHSNAARMRAIVAHWQKDVMLERKEGKVRIWKG